MFLPRRGAGLSSFVGIQIFWILFWISSLGIPWRLMCRTIRGEPSRLNPDRRPRKQRGESAVTEERSRLKRNRVIHSARSACWVSLICRSAAHIPSIYGRLSGREATWPWWRHPRARSSTHAHTGCRLASLRTIKFTMVFIQQFFSFLHRPD